MLTHQNDETLSLTNIWVVNIALNRSSFPAKLDEIMMMEVVEVVVVNDEILTNICVVNIDLLVPVKKGTKTIHAIVLT